MMTDADGSLDEFSLFALDYEDDRHFFLAQYFRTNMILRLQLTPISTQPYKSLVLRCGSQIEMRKPTMFAT